MRRSTIFEFLNNRATLNGEKIRLRPRRLEDAINEYRWRTDEELCRLDATIPLEFNFPYFLERYTLELEFPGLIYTVAIETLADRHIGNCSLFNFNFIDGNAEVGIIIGEKDIWGQGYGRDAVKTFLSFVFQVSDINTALLRTLDWNTRAQACFSGCGFTTCGNLVKESYNFIVMELGRARFIELNQ